MFYLCFNSLSFEKLGILFNNLFAEGTGKGEAFRITIVQFRIMQKRGNLRYR